LVGVDAAVGSGLAEADASHDGIYLRVLLDETLDGGLRPVRDRRCPAGHRYRKEQVVLHRFDPAPGAFVGLVADAEIEEAGAIAAEPLDRQMKKELAGAGIGCDAVVDRSELADHMVALAPQAGDRRNMPLTLTPHPHGVETTLIDVIHCWHSDKPGGTLQTYCVGE